MADGGTRAELVELYKISIEEYRFQATLNWNRTQYYLGLNVGMIGIATGILELSSGGVGFLTGGKVTTFNSILLCILAVMNCVGALVVFVGVPT